MLKPPTLPQNVLLAGKISVGLGWLFCVIAPMVSQSHAVMTIAEWLAVFLVGSHAVELLLYGAFLKAANATKADYVQVFLFGIFHSGGLQAKQD
ncbi:MAG TPA: hypothetical protein PLF22_10435 [Pseudomonadales bacterium]|nr:hypothetical protein [Pseudomonadales bacterium]